MKTAAETAAVLGAAGGAAGTYSTAWIKADAFLRYMGIAAGFAAVTTLDAKLEQATSAAGAGAKDVTGKVATQIADGAAKQIVLDLIPADDLDIANGFVFFRLTHTAAAGPSAGLVLGVDGVNGPAKDFDAASVAQVL